MVMEPQEWHPIRGVTAPQSQSCGLTAQEAESNKTNIMVGAWKAILVTAWGLALVGCSSSKLLPHSSNNSSASFQTYEQVGAAYASVNPGVTRTPDLAGLGFDTATGANAESLTYIGIGNRFLLQTDQPTSHIPAQVEACIKAQERCSGFVFHLQRLESRHIGNVLGDAFGFKKIVVDSGWTAEVMLVLQDGVVIYKIMSGRPRLEQTHDIVQPLGVLQDIGNTTEEPQSKKKH